MSAAKSGAACERVGCPRISLRSAGYSLVKGWEADERPEPRSLGLLPSGPDPVGEWLVHRQPPGPYIGRGGGESKRRATSPRCAGESARRHPASLATS